MSLTYGQQKSQFRKQVLLQKFSQANCNGRSRLTNAFNNWKLKVFADSVTNEKIARRNQATDHLLKLVSY